MSFKALVFVAALAIPSIATAQSGSTTSGSTTGTNKQGTSGSTTGSTSGSTSGSKSGTTAGQTGTTGSMDKTGTAGTAKTNAKLEGADLQVVAHLNHVNQMEIDMGKMAQRQGTAKVKTYGAMLIKDHTAAMKDLKAMAKKKGVAKIPADKPTSETMQKEHQDMMDAMARMKKLKGAEFDREFLTMMIADHDKEVSRVDAAMSTATDPELKTFLSSVRPTLQRHADQARELQRGMSEVSTSGSTNTVTGTSSSTGTTGSKTGTTGSTGTSGGATASPAKPTSPSTTGPRTTK